MVRELFGLQSAPIDQPASPPATAPSEAPELSSETSPPVAVAKPLPVLPIVIGAVGVALIAAGVGFGMSAKSNEDAYAKLKIPQGDTAAAGRAQAKIDSAATQAMLSNVGFGVGAAAVAAGIVLFVLQSQSGDDHDAAQAGSGMRLASRMGQLTLSGSWN
jgi:hypothetical protein